MNPHIANNQVNIYLAEEDLRDGGEGGGEGERPPPYFFQSLVFCNHFEELRTKLFEVELIINNAPLIYVYPNTIETCLTTNSSKHV